jgi:23S rRNA (uridine2552-2'-O)-methyltransferase
VRRRHDNRGARRERGNYNRHDGYFKRARQEGYAARSVYKLEEIQQRTQLLKAGMCVLDLGCAPGAWVQLTAKIVGERGRVVGVDITPVQIPLPSWATALEADVDEVEIDLLRKHSGRPFDVVLSDLAPHTSGVRHVDQARSARLVERAAEIAVQGLVPGGAFVAKVFDSADTQQLIDQLRAQFSKVRRLRPRATRTHSKEIYLVATGLRRAHPSGSPEARGEGEERD